MEAREFAADFDAVSTVDLGEDVIVGVGPLVQVAGSVGTEELGFAGVVPTELPMASMLACGNPKGAWGLLVNSFQRQPAALARA